MFYHYFDSDAGITSEISRYFGLFSVPEIHALMLNSPLSLSHRFWLLKCSVDFFSYEVVGNKQIRVDSISKPFYFVSVLV